MAENRRSRRILASIPLEVEAQGRRHRVLTAVINLHGAMILSPVDLPADSGFKIKNANTGIEVNARVVWSGRQSTRGSYKLGVEFEDSSPEFWGVTYDPNAIEVPWNK